MLTLDISAYGLFSLAHPHAVKFFGYALFPQNYLCVYRNLGGYMKELEGSCSEITSKIITFDCVVYISQAISLS